MDVKSIDEKKQIGDFKTVAAMLEKTTESVRMAWCRKKGKPFEEVRDALVKVIETREKIITTK